MTNRRFFFSLLSLSPLFNKLVCISWSNYMFQYERETWKESLYQKEKGGGGAVILVVLKNNFRLKVARLDLLILLTHSWCQNNHDYCLHFSLPSLSVLSHSSLLAINLCEESDLFNGVRRERETSYWVPGYKSFWWSGVERVKRKDDEFGLCCWLKSLFTTVPFVKLIWRRGFFPSSQLPSFPVHVSWLPKLHFLSFVFHFSSTLVSPVLLSSNLVLCQM